SIQHDKLFVNRLPAVITEFEILLQKDPDFLITYSRLGVLKIIASQYEKDKRKSVALLTEGFEAFKLGQQVFTRLGFDMRSKYHHNSAQRSILQLKVFLSQIE